jgi:hypothetical protein
MNEGIDFTKQNAQALLAESEKFFVITIKGSHRAVSYSCTPEDMLVFSKIIELTALERLDIKVKTKF